MSHRSQNIHEKNDTDTVGRIVGFMGIGIIEEDDLSLLPEIDDVGNNQVTSLPVLQVLGVLPWGRNDDTEMSA